MKVSFQKTDRLIELFEDSSVALREALYWKAYKLKYHENPVIRNLYSELVELLKMKFPKKRSVSNVTELLQKLMAGTMM